MKYSVLVNTCDKFEDCWNPFFKLLGLYWRDYKGKIYLNTEYKDYSFPDLDIIPVKGCIGKKINGSFATWSQCLKWDLDSIPEDVILYLQEDYFLKSQVQTSMIDDAVKLVHENKDIKCIHLTDQGCSTSGPSAYEGYDQCVLHDKIVKGRWYEETIPLFEKHGIVMDWSKRGLLSEIKPETFCQKTKRRLGRVPRYFIAYLDLFELCVNRYI